MEENSANLKMLFRMRANNPVKQKKWILPKYEWADWLREKIWEKTKSPCSWYFKTYYVKCNERVSFLGACKECNAKIRIVIGSLLYFLTFHKSYNS